MGSRVKAVQTCLWAGRARNLETGQPCPQCVLKGGDNYESENPWCQARNFSVDLVECSHLELWGVMGPSVLGRGGQGLGKMSFSELP